MCVCVASLSIGESCPRGVVCVYGGMLYHGSAWKANTVRLAKKEREESGRSRTSSGSTLPWLLVLLLCGQQLLRHLPPTPMMRACLTSYGATCVLQLHLPLGVSRASSTKQRRGCAKGVLAPLAVPPPWGGGSAHGLHPLVRTPRERESQALKACPGQRHHMVATRVAPHNAAVVRRRVRVYGFS